MYIGLRDVTYEFVSNICEALNTSLITEKEIRGGWAREMAQWPVLSTQA